MVTSKNILNCLFLLGLFFFSFNDYEGIAALGEFKKEAGAIFFLFGFFFLIIEFCFTKKISIPYKNILFRLIIVFLVWCFTTTLLNFPGVLSNYFKQTSGINRFFRQYFALLISSIIFFIFYWNVLVKMSIRDILFKIRKVFLLSLVVSSIYGFLETLVTYFGIHSLTQILKLFDYFPFLEVDLDTNGRISSICYEPPFFAIYLITISGWMFSYVLTEKSVLRFVPTIVVILLTFFSGSRTGLIVVLFQLFIFTTILYKNRKYRKYIGYGFLSFVMLFSLLVVFNGEKVTKAVSEKVNTLDFKHNLTKSISNQSRFGMQYASLQVFKENPIIGVGFGQQTYHARFHYPGWATRDNYEFRLFYKNTTEPSFPPGYNIYTRILAETGIVGFLIILIIIYLTIKTTKTLVRNSTDEKQILSYVLLISFSGLFVNWMQIDTFRMYGIWISLAILIRLTQGNKVYNE